MGLRPSSLVRPKISLTWVLRGENAGPVTSNTDTVPQKQSNLEDPVRPVKEHSVISDPGRRRDKRVRHRRARRAHSRSHTPNNVNSSSRFGYEITDVDAFLTKASLDSPGNIPVVLSTPCLLYQTNISGEQDELSLPLGMVVNAVFKNQGWLYVQTPHGEEGYVRYGACLPLGILPPKTPAPCWETHTDIFPQPIGNRTDTEKMKVTSGTRSECGGIRNKKYNDTRDTVSDCGERNVDKLYLRATANAKVKARAQSSRQTLLVIRADYNGPSRSTLSVCKGDVVALVSGHVKDWFWVRNKNGHEGFIPAVIAGHGFL